MDHSFFILAPMRGITTFLYRETFVRHFGGLDAAMAPFIPTVAAERINPKLLRDVLPENNRGLPLIPQLLGNNGADFVQMAGVLHDSGYDEVNWNLGCPHKPVRRKQRGSGLLPCPDRVDALLDTICAGSPCRVSVKVRLGMSDRSELMALIPVLNRYPLSEVIIHPRTAEQMYDGCADLDAFDAAARELRHPLCYNGDLNTRAFFGTVQRRFPDIRRFMLGRGLLADPFLAEDLSSAHLRRCAGRIDRVRAFHADLLERYEAVLQGDQPVLGKMKEFWTYQSMHLSNGPALFKRLKKTQRLSDYRTIVDRHLSEAEWIV